MRSMVTVALLLGACSGATSEHAHEHFEEVGADRARLQSRLEARIAETRAAVPDSIDDFVVAIDLLDSGTSRRLSIDENVVLHAASTMKVPVLFELFRQAEAGELSLEDSVPIVNRFRSILDGSTYTLTPADDSEPTLYARLGGHATYAELARLMIVRSSNLATNILIVRVDPRRVRDTLLRLNAQGMRVLRGVEDIPAYRAGLNNTTTAYGFSRVLEAIARCELLTDVSCERIADILAEQEFDDGIPAGVPPGTRVANKTGWITAINHDGAIVYPPGRAPYVLVVLTRGIEEAAVANDLIADLSGIVWQEVVDESGGP
ncbi:MAG TPA: serine hydrolase [Longimicrobiales bacterium]|nr:serine hydrolase [Longimicrobiales bacterium]